MVLICYDVEEQDSDFCSTWFESASSSDSRRRFILLTK